MNKALAFLKADLAQRIVTVTFRKVNGDIRMMDCTLNMDLVPQSKWPKSAIVEDENAETLSVYDIKADGWRSFYIKNILEVASNHLTMKWPVP